MLEFFEKLEEEARLAKEAEDIRLGGYWMEEVQCEHCGDWIRRALLENNHRIMEPRGWCLKRWFLTQRSIGRQTREQVARKWSGKDIDQVWALAQEDIAWLKEKGFPLIDMWTGEPVTDTEL